MSSTTTDRLVRYGAVTAVNVALGLAVLVLVHGLLGWHGAVAAMIAVVTSAVPCFVLNRRFVWRRAGRIRVRAELVPFAMFTAVGLVASSALVWWAERRYGAGVTVYVAHQSAFGVLWVLRYFLFDRVLWQPWRPTVRRLPRRRVRPLAQVVDDLAA